MENQRWVIIDTETDGLSAPIHVVEIAAQLMEGAMPIGKPFQVFLNHDVPIPPNSVAIHGYTQEFLRERGIPPSEAHERFRTFVGMCPITSHNLRFDWDLVLVPEWSSLGVPQIGSRGFCLLKLARRLVCETPNYSLDALRDAFGVSNEDRHHALGDVAALVELFRRVYVPRLGRARVHTFGTWVTFSTAVRIGQCWGRALSPEQLNRGLRRRDQCLAEESWAHIGAEDICFSSFRLHRELRRIHRSGKRDARIHPKDFLLLRSAFERFPRLREQRPGVFVYKWIRDHTVDESLPEDKHQEFLDAIERVLHPDQNLRSTGLPHSPEQEILSIGHSPDLGPRPAEEFQLLEETNSATFPLLDKPGFIVFRDRSFCFTGKFAFGTRSKCERAVIERGGRCSRRPTCDTDYLVVGNLGGFGSKVDEINNLKKAGSTVQTVAEELWEKFMSTTKSVDLA